MLRPAPAKSPILRGSPVSALVSSSSWSRPTGAPTSRSTGIGWPSPSPSRSPNGMTSPWTLDYPPLFAYFERLLAVFARLVDPTITDLRCGLNYASGSVVLFQRLSVAASDLALFYGVHRLAQNLGVRERRLLFLLIVWSPALMIVDHVHFQYNGFLIGVLLVSISLLGEGRDLAGGFVFAVVLCLKHLFAVAGPVYFVYLLRHYCKGDGLRRGVGRFFMMGAAVGSVFAVAFGPFLYYDQVTPVVTFLLVLLTISPALVKAWRNSQPKHVIRWMTYAFTCGYLFGWHVHEKASLHFVIPLAVTAICGLEEARHYFLLSIVSCYSLFPLLFQPEDYLIKVLLLVIHSVLMWVGFSLQLKDSTTARRFDEAKEMSLQEKTGDGLIGWFDIIYLIGMLGVEIWGQFLHPYFLGDKLPFLPLMSVSMYCSLGMTYSWLWQLRWLIRNT